MLVKAYLTTHVLLLFKHSSFTKAAVFKIGQVSKLRTSYNNLQLKFETNCLLL